MISHIQRGSHLRHSMSLPDVNTHDHKEATNSQQYRSKLTHGEWMAPKYPIQDHEGIFLFIITFDNFDLLLSLKPDYCF